MTSSFAWRRPDVPFARARNALVAIMDSLAGVLVTIGVMRNWPLWQMFTRPVTQSFAHADRAGMEALDAPEIQVRSRDEVRTLAHDLARMRKSMGQALKMLDA